MTWRPPSYHDLHITTRDIPRTSIFNLPYAYQVLCTRSAGWELWLGVEPGMREAEKLVAGEYCVNGLRLDIDGHVIADSLTAELQVEEGYSGAQS